MTIDDTIGIVLDDIHELSPKLADTIYKLGDMCFKTIIKDNNGKTYTIIDFENKQLYDAQSYVFHSRNLYSNFMKYNKEFSHYDKEN